jgi:hypothetical protein
MLFAGCGGPDPSTTIIGVDGRASNARSHRVRVDRRLARAGIRCSHLLPVSSIAPLAQGSCVGRFLGGCDRLLGPIPTIRHVAHEFYAQFPPRQGPKLETRRAVGWFRKSARGDSRQHL